MSELEGEGLNTSFNSASHKATLALSWKEDVLQKQVAFVEKILCF